MRSYDKLLLASKKPHIKELVSRIESLTEDEIKILPERSWIIKGLLTLHKRKEQSISLNIANALADIMINASIKQTEDLTTYFIYQNVNGCIWVNTDPTSSIGIENSWYWLRLDEKTIWATNNKISISSDIMNSIILNSRFIKTGTMNEYRELEANRLRNL